MSLIDEIQHGNVGAAITLMNSAPQPVVILNQRNDVTGEFPLHYAVKQGLSELATMMMDKGAKVNCSNASGLTPLHYAARKGNVEMMNLLLSKGAFKTQDTTFFWTPLHYAAYHGHKAVVERLLETEASTGNQLVNETDSWARSALHVACKQGHVDIANLLLKAGAQIRKDSTGHSPFFYLSIRDVGKDKPDFYLDSNYAEASSTTLCSDLRSLFESGALSDVTFVVEGLPEPNEDGVVPEGAMATTQEYKAHRAIIHARCPALLKDQAPFRSVKSENRVEVAGLTHSLFSAVMEYIYCGGIAFKETDLDFVFNLAKKGQEFELPALSSFAESMILSNLNEENVVSILEAATLFGCCPRVESYCRYYIIRFFDKISQAGSSEDLDKLPPSQFEDVLSRLPIASEPSPSSIHIDSPPHDFLSVKPSKPAAPLGMGPPINTYATTAAATAPPPASSYATPKAAKPKKPKQPKAEKVDSPRGSRGSGASGATPPGGVRHSPMGAPASSMGGTPAGPPDAMQGRTLELAKKLLKDIMGDVEAEMFNVRVAYEAMGLPDYPWIIKRPMDLGTVLKNMNARVYKTLADWAADVRLVWDNAKTYNAPESEVYQAAERLCRMTEQGYAHLQRQLDLHNYDPFVHKPHEWYINTYKRHYQEFLDANPQFAQPLLGSSSGSLPPPSSAANPVKSSPGAKKTRAAPPTTSSPSSNASNRKRKPDLGAEEYDLAHAHTSAPSTHYNGASTYAAPVAAAPVPVAPQPTTLSHAEQERLQERLGMLDEAQAGEVIKILNIQPNEEGEYVIAIESLPPDTIRVLADFLVAATGPF
jgi:ankyrin repeat protein